ncbi:MAG: exosortase F system-associated protein [Bacteroidia bacterium]|nr:exosortase F system-associated protein [Bacteroidia bacterium]MBT8309976.1 exosortase F system-associated protein [Bacteroidia bacterium]NND10549.1 exosortase F system-associated protein [Flavobacteriaceae bacterium]NNL61666.1 exosortase F system-associated protein [Flavobacteriaceae bacterium]
MNNFSKVISVGILAGLLILIRVFESQLFYDPYLLFFQDDYLRMDYPNREVFKLIAFTTLRYLLNTLISLGIIYIIFKDKSMIKFAAILYVIAYLILLVLFLYFVLNPRQEDYLIFFYIRRFLIQPILLLLLLPAFYYFKKS